MICHLGEIKLVKVNTLLKGRATTSAAANSTQDPWALEFFS